MTRSETFEDQLESLRSASRRLREEVDRLTMLAELLEVIADNLEDEE
jgi:hypothetical protein